MTGQGSVSYKLKKENLSNDLKGDQIRFYIDKETGVFVYEDKDNKSVVPFNDVFSGNVTGEFENQNYTIPNLAISPNFTVPLRIGQIVAVTFFKGNVGDNPTFNLQNTGALPLVKPGFLPLKAGDIQALDNYIIAYVGTAYSIIGSFYKNLYGKTGAAETTAYTVSVDKNIDVLQDGYGIDVLFAKGNTGASTLKVNGTAVKPLKKNDFQDLIAGDIANDNMLLRVVYIKANDCYLIQGL